MINRDIRVASKIRSHFHRVTCDWADYFMWPGDFLEFDNRDEAIDSGLKPCKTCCS